MFKKYCENIILGLLSICSEHFVSLVLIIFYVQWISFNELIVETKLTVN